MRILSVASEIFPLVKTGGLADVTGALPSALAAKTSVGMVKLVRAKANVLPSTLREILALKLSAISFFGSLPGCAASV